jgi:hypothetical protein
MAKLGSLDGLSHLKSIVARLLFASALIGFLIAALVLGSIVALLLVAIVALALVLAVARGVLHQLPRISISSSGHLSRTRRRSER